MQEVDHSMTLQKKKKKHVLTFQVDYEVSIVVYFREHILDHNNPESKDAVTYYIFTGINV